MLQALLDIFIQINTKAVIHMKKGIFIAFEGLDGSGKTTQFNAISTRLANMNIKCKEEKEPSAGNPIGLMLRDIVKSPHGPSLSPLSLAKLFSVDRYEHVINDIKPHIDAGIHVLVDRFVFSSFAYQGLTCSFDEIYFWNQHAIELLMPDITVFIDTDPEVCMQRIVCNRAGMELFDSNGIVIRQNFYSAFEKMQDIAEVVIVDGNQPCDVVTESIWNRIETLFSL